MPQQLLLLRLLWQRSPLQYGLETSKLQHVARTLPQSLTPQCPIQQNTCKTQPNTFGLHRHIIPPAPYACRPKPRVGQQQQQQQQQCLQLAVR